MTIGELKELIAEYPDDTYVTAAVFMPNASETADTEIIEFSKNIIEHRDEIIFDFTTENK